MGEENINAGMQDYCTKPDKPEALDVMIQRWLGSCRQQSLRDINHKICLHLRKQLWR